MQDDQYLAAAVEQTIKVQEIMMRAPDAKGSGLAPSEKAAQKNIRTDARRFDIWQSFRATPSQSRSRIPGHL
jgi:hypothetical protein